MIGQTVSHYRILEELGGGGMGVVYKAQDTKLKRTVALKFLPPELTRDKDAKTRFIHEAQAASALDHPNICTIHEIDETDDGRMFICMACYEAESLKERIEHGPLEIADAVVIASSVADGLAKAHEKGITHRDIKPANILITGDDQVKIVDFGLAKLGGRTRITKTGTTVGTVAYMSPEQALGEETDGRTDIWSLGVILFEMLTGKLPFRGDVEPALLYSIVNEDPESITTCRADVPPELGRIVSKCLAKIPAKRYKTAANLIADLRQISRRILNPSPLSTPPEYDTGRIESLAILPFANTGSDQDTEYLSDELPASIMNSLSRLSSLRVVPRSTVFRYKGREVDLRTVGRELNVGAVLTGQVRVRGEEISIRAELVDVVNDRQLWGDRYARKLTDILSLEQQIAVEISEALKLQLTGTDRDRLTQYHTESAEAHGLYLIGRHSWNKRSEEGLKSATAYFQKAIDKDPNYALAYSGLADSYIVLVAYGFLPPGEAFPKAKLAASRALEIDNTLAEAHVSLAFVMGCYDWDWVGAERRYKRAIELNPRYATTLHWYSFNLVRMGRVDEAIAVSERAVDLDPLSLPIMTNLGYWHFVAREYDKAEKQCLMAIDMDPEFHYAHSVLGMVYAQKGKHDRALKEWILATELSDNTPENVAYLGHEYAMAGMEDEARKILREFERLAEQRYVPPCFLALIHVGLGERDKAFEWLNKAYEDRDYYLSYQLFEPNYDSVRNDTRFGSLLLRMGPGLL